jgi:hypothetical protein
MIDQYEETGMVRMAGLIARFFRIDPMVVLKSSWRDYAIRAAAYRYVSRIEREEQQRQNAQHKSK